MLPRQLPMDSTANALQCREMPRNRSDILPRHRPSQCPASFNNWRRRDDGKLCSSGLFSLRLQLWYLDCVKVINMDKLTDKIAALPKDATYFSLEFFPPKTQAVRNTLPQSRVSVLTFSGLLKPPSASVAHGTGAETALRHSNMGCRW